MKFKLKITEDILERSKMCSLPSINENCAFALAFNELIPKVYVGSNYTVFSKKDETAIGMVENTEDQKRFIENFDHSTPEERINIPEQEFEVEIPDKVIEYWYGDTVKAVQKLIDNPVLTPINL